MEDRKIFNRDTVLKESINYFNGDELAANVWINKYCLKDSEGNLYEKTPDDMHRRISKELARIESKYPNPLNENDIYDTLKNFNRIVPQGSPMAGIGNNFQVVSLGNCFVVGNNSDSYGGIFQIDQEQAQLMKRRGGVGHDLSHIRPKNFKVNNSALTSTGVVPFMERFSNTTREVAQEGRRGALMLSISIKHPDSVDFIDAKLENGKVTGANVSVRIDDEFMECVRDGKPYTQQFPIDSDNPEFTKEIDAIEVWNKIIHNAWKSAEPGILFWDTLINESIPTSYGGDWKEKSTNPCGELPLPPYDSCRLLLINLYGYVENPFTEEAKFNTEKFEKDVIIAQRYMDDIIDLEVEKIDQILEKIINDPESDFIKNIEKNLWEKIKAKALEGRRTGLGITAEGDMLAALGLRYGSEESIEFAENIHKILKLKAYESSVILSKERGSFPIYNSEKEENNPFILRIKKENPELFSEMVKYGRRNIALLTIAPAGTTSLMTQTTSGIEPVFLPNYTRRRKINPNDKDVRIDFIDEVGDSWMEYPVFHHKFKTWLKINGYDLNRVKNELTKDQIEEIVSKSPYHNATSNNIDWVNKVEMQGRIQKHIDHSISVTVNLPNDVNEELVSKVYMKGWESGCKGITIYRDGSRSGVLISENDKIKENELKIFDDYHSPKRPKRLKGEIIRFQNNHEKWVGVVGFLDDRPYEIFTGKLENGLSNLPQNLKDCEIVKTKTDVGSRYDIEYIDGDNKKTYNGLNHVFNPEYWNYARLISGILRHGMPLSSVYSIVDSLQLNEDHLNTWKAGVKRIIRKHLKEGEKVKGKCEECDGTNLEFKEGCMTCMDCGSSKCS